MARLTGANFATLMQYFSKAFTTEAAAFPPCIAPARLSTAQLTAGRQVDVIEVVPNRSVDLAG